ncbi:MAG TPA: hypothetical protein VHO48_02505, partial [Anaerolineaceae bacterium]|nr:hypothetical protein [Anaerolineaceae bacterium]
PRWQLISRGIPHGPGYTVLKRRTAILWAFLAGLGWWANGLSLVFSVPSGLYLLWLLLWKTSPRGRWPGIAAMLAGFLVGSAPWWLYALRTGPQQLVGELFGGAVAVESTPWLVQVSTHLVSLVLLGVTALFGLRPPWEARWLVLPLAPLALAFWLAAIGSAGHYLNHRLAEKRVLFGILLLLTAGFLFTSFGVDPSGRYFLPLIIPLALLGAGLACKFIRRPVWQAGLIGLVVVFQAAGTIQALSTSPTGLTTQFYAPSVLDHRFDPQLMGFLEQNGETRGYSTYWVAYPLAFQSAERLIFVPSLPYHPDLRYTPRDNRYSLYQASVDASDRVAYINTTRNPALSQRLRAGLEQQGVTWSEQIIGDYQVFYQLSRPVRPEELDLGRALGEEG